MSIVDRIAESLQALRERERLLKTTGSSAFLYGVTGKSEEKREAFAQALHNGTKPGEPTLKDITSQ